MSGDFMVGFSKVSALVCLLCKVTVESTFSELGPYSVKRDLLQWYLFRIRAYSLRRRLPMSGYLMVGSGTVHVHIHVYIYIYICTYIHTLIYMLYCMYIYGGEFWHSAFFVCVCVCGYIMCVCVCVCVRVCNRWVLALSLFRVCVYIHL